MNENRIVHVNSDKMNNALQEICDMSNCSYQVAFEELLDWLMDGYRQS